MLQEKVDLYRAMVDAWNRGDVDYLLELVSDDVEVFSALTAVDGNYRGHAGVRRWWQDYHDVFPDFYAKLLAVHARGEATIAHLHIAGHGGESGAPVEQRMWHVVHWRDGKAIRISRHDDEAEALEAAGLSE
jgi:ketosteroid isomerase-like protein